MEIVEIISIIADIVLILSLLFISVLSFILFQRIYKVLKSFNKTKNDVIDFINIFTNPSQISSSTIKSFARGIKFINRINQPKK